MNEEKKTEQVVDIKRIVDALEGAGCEVKQVREYFNDQGGYTSDLAIVVTPCLKPIPE